MDENTALRIALRVLCVQLLKITAQPQKAAVLLTEAAEHVIVLFKDLERRADLGVAAGVRHDFGELCLGDF